MVEPIHPTANQYGTDVERISMTFREFLDSLRKEEGPHPYLTTQYSDEDPDAETVFPPPTNALKDDFPHVPRIMGNLFLQQVNLWLGKSKSGSSSGLHHDFHDNIYCLLKGKKRFVLFPPSEAKHLYPYGTLDTLHPNGLISYEDIPVRSDGLSRRAACKARVRALERKIDALKTKEIGKGKGKGKGQSKEMKALMDAHDAALDELAELALDEEEGEGEVDDFDALMGGLDDFEDVDAGSSGHMDEDDDEDGDEEDNEEDEWKGIGHSDDEHEVSGDENNVESDDEEGDEAPLGEEPAHTEPSSFSRIPTAHLHRYLGIPTTAALPSGFSPSEFPGLKKTTDPYVVELSEGEMLYLPASWWHEVTSTSAAGDSAAGGNDVHMAFNYWFYPPDALENFETPYRDTLVWDYLRRKSDTENGNSPEAVKNRTVKRARDDAVGGNSKRVRR
ncbi:Clavaminate synthase-like protein [Cubamyces menziesii]|nr:Clavaminate synthase-like protein [Cubamyces menziesii]